MKKLPIYFKVLLFVIAFSLLPAYMAIAAASSSVNVSPEVPNPSYHQSGQVNIIRSQNKNKSSASPQTGEPIGYLGGNATNLGNKTMRVTWDTVDLVSEITWIEQYVYWGDGDISGLNGELTYNVNPPTFKVQNEATHQFATAGYHTAEVTTEGYDLDGGYWVCNAPLQLNCTLTN